MDCIERKKKIITSLSKKNTELKGVVSKLEVILCKKDVELGTVKGKLDKFNSSSSTLDSILMMGKDDDKPGLCFNQSIFETGETSKPTIFVKASGQSSNAHAMCANVKNLPTKGKVTGHTSKPKKRRYVCHYCWKSGHIKPYCFKLRYDCMNWKNSRMMSRDVPNIHQNILVNKLAVKKIWVPKVQIQCNVIYTSLRTNIAGHWYFVSGSSRHMIGSRNCLVDYIEQFSDTMTYGGGAKGRIIGRKTTCRRTSQASQCFTC